MRNRKLILSALIALIAVTFNACIEDPEPAPLDAVADAFIQKTVKDGEVKYAAAFWTFANKPIESTTVEGPDDNTWQLTKEPDNALVFSLFPENTQYSDTVPAPGDYKFTIASTQEGETPLTVIDKLENNELDTISIDSTQYTDTKLKITWAEVEDADNYMVRLYDDEENLIFVSPSITHDKRSYSFGNNDTGWANSTDRAITGETYRVELMALLYETTSNMTNQGYNIQFISHTSKNIVWGE